MDRRKFFKIAAPLSLTPIALNGFTLRPYANSKLARMMAGCEDVEERVLVLVQLKGGNDGLNTIIPIEQYETYAQLRPSIAVPETAFIPLDNTLASADQVGLNPALTAFKDLYDSGKMHVIQGVGYENMNQSHFKGTDLWMTGGDTTQTNNSLASGWMGRALESIYPEVQGAPTQDMPDPLGIQLGDPNPSLGFHTEDEHQASINLSGQDPAGFYSLIQTIGGQPLSNVPNSDYGAEIDFIQGVERSVNAYAQRISDVFNAGSNAGTYPDESFANQLKTVARLVAGGCKTKIFLTTIGGFDTHAAQVFANGNGVEGQHSALLVRLSEGIKAFYDDLAALGLDEKITTVTFSEFGRCARENGSEGTDHGTLEPMFVFGKSLNPGVSGTNVNLSDLTNDFQLQHTQFDYRQVFATVLQDWLGANNDTMEDVYFENYQKMDFIAPSFVVDPDCYLNTTAWFEPQKQANPLRISPNPASVYAEARIEVPNGFVGQLSIFDAAGKQIFSKTVQVEGGVDNFFMFSTAAFSSGHYAVRLVAETGKLFSTKMVVAR